jgi:AraC-like DNA-binding protein
VGSSGAGRAEPPPSDAACGGADIDEEESVGSFAVAHAHVDPQSRGPWTVEGSRPLPDRAGRTAALLSPSEARIARGAPHGALLVVLRGDVWLTCGASALALQPDALALLAAGCDYRVRGTRDPLLLEVQLAPGDLSDGDDAALREALCDAATVAHVAPDVQRAVTRVLAALGAGASTDAAVDVLAAAVRSYLRDAVRYVARVPAERRATQWDLFRRTEAARTYVRRALDAVAPGEPVSRPLSLDDLARAVCLSPFYFARCFSVLYDESPVAFVARLRLERARALLAEHPRLGSGAAGRLVGFRNASAFSRAFARRFGAPPTATRSA